MKKNGKLLTGFGQALLFQSLRLPEEDLQEWIKESERFQGLNYETRNENGLSVLYVGMKLIQAVYKEMGADFKGLTGFNDDMISEILIQNHEESLESNGISKSAVEQIIETFDQMASNKLLDNNVHYVVNKTANELQLYMPKLYPEFTKYYKDYYLMNEIEPLTKSDFIAQLKRTEYFIRSDGRVFKIGGDSYKYKCLILDLRLISQKLETEVFFVDLEVAADDGFIYGIQEELPFDNPIT